MSTRSRIILKLKNEDKNKTLKFDESKLNALCKFDGCCEFVGTEGEVTIDDTDYISIYHHWDGYIEGLGDTLFKLFKSYDEVLNLILLGDCSSILDGQLCPYHSWRNEEWETVKPMSVSDIENTDFGWAEFIYVFEDGQWFVAVPDYKDGKSFLKKENLEPLDKALARIAKEKN